MAKQWGSYMGGFSGKLGPAVGYMWNGIWVMRSRPQMVRNPRTPKQVEHREAFRQQVRLAASMRSGVLQGLTTSARLRHMTSYNLFVSLNQGCFAMSDGEMQVDWGHLVLSEGVVAPVSFGVPTVDERNVLTVSFDPNRGARCSKGMDCVHLYVYCPTLGEGCLAAPVFRRDRRVSVSLPDAFAGQELHLYGFVQDREGEGSPTAYVGLTADGTAVDAWGEVAQPMEAALPPTDTPLPTAAAGAADSTATPGRGAAAVPLPPSGSAG